MAASWPNSQDLHSSAPPLGPVGIPTESRADRGVGEAFDPRATGIPHGPMPSAKSHQGGVASGPRAFTSFTRHFDVVRSPAMSSGDYAQLLLRLFVDGCALGALSLLVARRRPRRGLFMVYATFNLGLFVVLTVISARHVGPAIGFGLFAMLSIVRLRSEPIGNAELAYFFCALVLALVNGLPVDDEPLIIGLNVLVLLTLN